MPSRTAKFASAMFASILVGTTFTTISQGETVKSDGCLSGPNGEPRSGSHWYYRIEHSTKRHCWYLRSEAGRLTQSAPQNILPPAKRPAPQADPAPQHSVADARAELPAQTDRNDGPNTAWPAIAPESNDPPRADASDPNAASTVVNSRWPETSGVNSVFSPRAATSKLAANVPASPAAAPAPAVAPVTLAAADTSLQSQLRPIPKPFIAVVGSALLVIAAGVIFKFGRARRPRRATVRARRRPVWEQTDDDRIVLSDDPGADVLPRRSRFARGVGETRHPDDRMADFLSQISGRASR
jgi:hypothetical protein